MSRIALISTILVMTLLASAQSPPATPGIRRISVDVGALDGSGVPVPNLTQADFEVFDNGAPQAITAFAAPEAGSSILILFDNNNAWLRDQKSVQGPTINMWPRMQAALGD